VNPSAIPVSIFAYLKHNLHCNSATTAATSKDFVMLNILVLIVQLARLKH